MFQIVLFPVREKADRRRQKELRKRRRKARGKAKGGQKELAVQDGNCQWEKGMQNRQCAAGRAEVRLYSQPYVYMDRST